MSLYPFPAAHLQEPAAPAPAGPPVAGQALWLDVLRPGALWRDLGRTQPAGEFDGVASWYDATSGIAATQATAAQRPLRDGGVAFDGLDDLLEAASGLGVSGATGLTIVTVATIAADVGALFGFSASSPGAVNDGPALTRAFDILYARAYQGGGTSDIVRNADSATGPRVYAWRVSNAARQLWIDGISVGADARPLTIPAMQRLLIGSWYDSFYPLDGQIAMLVVYPSALTDAQIATLSAWAAARHSI
jgi:hypothetical protein